MRSTGAFFLDRDGVIVEEVEYLARPEQLRLLPGAAAAIARLNQAGVPVVVITNQAGVAHGFFPEERVAEVHRRLDEMLASEGARIDGYYYCPHHPAGKVAAYRTTCACRKPAAGMLQRAAEEHSLDLRKSYMVGDKLSDIQAGVNAGCRPILVRTGYGAGVAATFDNGDLTAVVVAADLAEAVADCLPELTRGTQHVGWAPPTDARQTVVGAVDVVGRVHPTLRTVTRSVRSTMATTRAFTQEK